MYPFKTFSDLCDGEIRLVHQSFDEPDPEKNYLPRYGFSIQLVQTNEDIGTAYFCVDTTPRQYRVGHISYGVSHAHTGHAYAAKACMLLKTVALAHGFTRVFIGAARDNVASRKTILKLGAVPVAKGDVPEDAFAYYEDEKIDMFVWTIV